MTTTMVIRRTMITMTSWDLPLLVAWPMAFLPVQAPRSGPVSQVKTPNTAVGPRLLQPRARPAGVNNARSRTILSVSRAYVQVFGPFWPLRLSPD